MAKRVLPEINSSSMADIAFMLLIFFLVATTMDVDTGLSRVLPPPIEEKDTSQIDVRERNVFVVLINKDDRLLVENEPMQVSQLKDKCKEFVLNPNFDENLPEFQDTIAPILGPIKVTQGVVSLQNDRGTTFEMYIKVQNELVRAYNELRDERSMKEFGKLFEDLEDEDKIKAIKIAVPQRISEAEPKSIGGED